MPISRWRARAGRAATLGVAGFALAAYAVFARSEERIDRRYPVEPHALALVEMEEPGLVERGRHLVRDVAQCTLCHGQDLAGAPMADDVWIGRLWAPNLTGGRGGLAPEGRVQRLLVAMRAGIRSDGRSLWLMPTTGLRLLSDRELQAISAYLGTLPRVDRVVPERRAGPLARLALALDRAPDVLSAEGGGPSDRSGAAASPSVPRADLSEGARLVELASCRVCHRADLAGGLHPLSLPGEPPPPDLTRAGPTSTWSEADFVRAMRSGRTPEGRELDPRFMPWPGFARMSDRELSAIWVYLESLGSPKHSAAPVASGPAPSGSGSESASAPRQRHTGPQS